MKHAVQEYQQQKIHGKCAAANKYIPDKMMPIQTKQTMFSVLHTLTFSIAKIPGNL
jgi:hypothetical protein